MQYLEKYSSTVQQLAYRGWREWAGKKSHWQEKGQEVGDGTAKGSSAIGDRGQTAISFTPEADGTQVPIFESLQLENSYVGDLLYFLSQLPFHPGVAMRPALLSVDNHAEIYEGASA